MWLLVAISNITSLISAYKCGGSTSLTLFLGGIAGLIAVLVCPIQGVWVWFWLPLLIDPGSLLAAHHILKTYLKRLNFPVIK